MDKPTALLGYPAALKEPTLSSHLITKTQQFESIYISERLFETLVSHETIFCCSRQLRQLNPGIFSSECHSSSIHDLAGLCSSLIQLPSGLAHERGTVGMEKMTVDPC